MNMPPTPEEMQEILGDVGKMRQFFSSMPEAFWLGAGQQAAFATFKTAVAAVPAYREFLQEAGVNPDEVTLETLSQLPSMTKENYFHRHTLPETVAGGDISKAYWIATSSGTTGKVHYWPRFVEQDALSRVTGELMLSLFDVHDDKPTLCLIALFLGTWFGGTYSTDMAMQIGKRPGSKLTTMTPGANNKQILDTIQDIGGYYEQIVITAYPPTARSFLLEGIERGMDWKQYNIKLILGGEPVSSDWKEYVLGLLGSENPDDILVTFPMSEVGILSFETPLAARVRQIAHKDRALSKKLFGTANLAALTQYLPTQRWLDAENGEITITSAGAVPLVRYKSHDMGGVIRYGKMVQALSEAGYDLLAEFEKSGHKREDVWQWPFFYCTGRSNSIALLGAKIYPENLEAFVYAHPEINNFKIHLAHAKSQQPEFRVYLELREKVRLDSEQSQKLAREAAEEIHTLLLSNNEDYEDAFGEEGERVKPQVQVLEHGASYFADAKTKQQHVLEYDE